MLPCFLGIAAVCLSFRKSSAATTRARVSRGWITSSICPVAAAANGELNCFSNSSSESRAFRVPLRRQRLLQLPRVEDADRSLGAHHRHLGGRPRQADIGPDHLAAHDDVGAAVRLAKHHRHLGDGCLGVGVHDLCAVPDDAVPFLVGPGQEAGAVDQGHERDVERVREPYERAILSEASMSSTPARCSGWLAMTAATRPLRRMNPTTAFGAKPACTSRNE